MEFTNILNKYYGYKSFRPGQKEIITSIVNKKDVMVIMPTGGGKSLCYQIAALSLEGLTIVISPLISLMKDQVDTLVEMGIEATYINSTLSEQKISEKLRDISKNRYKIIYVAPERLDNYQFINIIKNLDISQVVVDEAHCISQWGHDFRTSYTKISDFIKNLSKRPVISAFTATASDIVKKDIIKNLNLINYDSYAMGFDRSNLKINIIKNCNKKEFILDFIEKNKSESGIIYAITRKSVEALYESLKRRNYNVTKYHGGLSNEERQKNQEAFVNDDINIIVATNAFGMGIDKSNIRWILHYNMPQSIENYYQEIGRAGRDGENSECTLLFSAQDIQTQKLLIDSSINNIERRKNQYDKLQHIIDLIYSNDCYRKEILSYFGEIYDDKCNNCSNCLNRGTLIDKTEDAMKVISCIIRMKRSYGINMLVDVLRGSKNKKVLNLGFQNLSTYGIMKNHKSDDLKIFINTLISKGYLDIKESTSNNKIFSTIIVNNLSKDIIKGKEKVMLYEITQEDNKKQINYLYEDLKQLRFSLAKENHIAPYMIFSDATLAQMSKNYPITKEEMLDISGIGEIKFDKYGLKFIEKIKSYIKDNNITKHEINNENSDDEYMYIHTDIDLYNRLKELRDFYAKKENKIFYLILSKNTLKEISGRYPQDEKSLLDISGIGPIKVKKYGDDILKLVQEYIEEKNIKSQWHNKNKAKIVIDGEDRKNNEIALDLLTQGKSIEEVSLELEVSISTILSYINEYLLEKNELMFNLDLSKYYTKEEKEAVIKVIKEHKSYNLNLIKKVLPSIYKYDTIMAIILEQNIKKLEKKKELC